MRCADLLLAQRLARTWVETNELKASEAKKEKDRWVFFCVIEGSEFWGLSSG